MEGEPRAKWGLRMNAVAEGPPAGCPCGFAEWRLVECFFVVACPSAANQLRAASMLAAAGSPAGSSVVGSALPCGSRSREDSSGSLSSSDAPPCAAAPDPSELRLTGETVLQCPRLSADDIPAGIWAFCFPLGLRLRRGENPPSPSLFHLGLTQLQGTRKYVACLEVWDEATPEVQRIAWEMHAASRRNHVFARVDTERWFLPSCFCVVTPTPCFTFCREWLRRFHDEVLACGAAMEQAVGSLLGLQPPVAGGSAVAPVADGVALAPLWEAQLDALPRLDAPLHTLVSVLGVDGVLAAVRCLLLEEKTLLVSADLTLLALASEALTALLYPFQWAMPFIPVLPDGLFEYVYSPMAFLIGMHASMLATRGAALPDDVAVVNLDSGAVAVPPGVARLPEAAEAALRADLARAWRPDRGNYDSLAWRPWGPVAPESSEDFNVLVRSCFLKSTCSLLRDYVEFVTYLRVFETPVTQFDSRGFCRDKGESQGFFTRLFETQMFVMFTEQHATMAPNLFDDLIAARCWELPTARVAELVKNEPLSSVRADLQLAGPREARGAAAVAAGVEGRTALSPDYVVGFERASLEIAHKRFARTQETATRYESRFHPTASPLKRMTSVIGGLSGLAGPPGVSSQNTLIERVMQHVLSGRAAQCAEVHVLKGSFINAQLRMQWLQDAVAAKSQSRVAHVSPEALDDMADICAALLHECLQARDYHAARKCLELGESYYTSRGNAEDFLRQRISGAEIWASLEFWEFFFAEKARTVRNLYADSLREEFRRWEQTDAAGRQAVVERELQFVFSLLAQTVSKMLDMGLQPAVIQKFATRTAGLVRLDDGRRKRIIQLTKLEDDETLLDSFVRVERPSETPQECVDARAIVLWVDGIKTPQTQAALSLCRKRAERRHNLMFVFASAAELKEWLLMYDLSSFATKLRIVANGANEPAGGKCSASERVLDVRRDLGLVSTPTLVFGTHAPEDGGAKKAGAGVKYTDDIFDVTSFVEKK
eukprot:m51a1_g10859 hypothetical protein (999) ;mRNA; f:238-3793